MFTDARSKRVILVAHCLLNQNAKLDRCAFYPGAIREAAQAILDAGAGMVQMPCPETLCLGLDRGADPNADRTVRPSVGEEDTRIAAGMQARENTDWMQTEAEEIVSQVEEYLKNGFDVLGVVGINGSPTCAVERTWYDDAEQIGPGVFIAILQETLAQRGIRLPMRGIRAAEPGNAVEAVEALLSGAD